MKYLLLISPFLIAISCHYHHDSISGNGEVKKVIVSEDTIRSLTISNRLNAWIIPSDTFRVEVNADENLHDHIHTDLYEGHLSVYTEKYIRMARSKEVLIYTDCIERIEASSGANVYTKDTLNCNEMSISASSAADVSVLGNFERVDIFGSSGSDLRINGSAEHATINLSSAADLHAYDFVIQNANVTVSSASDARVNVEQEARFNASSAGDIRYIGDPEIIESRTSSAADIKRSRK